MEFENRKQLMMLNFENQEEEQMLDMMMNQMFLNQINNSNNYNN